MKRQILSFLLSVLLLPAALAAQQTGTVAPPTQDSYNNGVYYAPNFGQWAVKLASTITSGSTTVFTVDRGTVQTPDGIVFVPFRANEKISLGSGTVGEIVTISSISGCNVSALSGTFPQCTITLSGTTTNSHFSSELVTSADSGIMEAIGYAEATVGAAGTAGAQVYFNVDCGIITLNTGGATTTSTCFVPNQFYNQGAAARVSTTITTATTWQLGVLGFLTSFTASNSTMAAGTTAFTTQGAYALNLATGATSPGLVAVLVTCTGTPAAGALKTKVWGYVAVQPAF